MIDVTLKKWLFALSAALAVVSPSLSLAAPYDAGGITVDADPSWVTGPVLQDAMALSKTLQRPVYTYHYVPRKLIRFNGQSLSQTGPLSPADRTTRQVIALDIQGRMARFWDLSLAVSGRADGGGAMAPNGLYVATEPVISESYGGPDWLMLQLQFREGSRYLDGRYDHPVMGRALGAALRARGCGAQTMRQLIKSDTSQSACRKALNDIVAATNSALIAYIFRAEPLKADCYGWGWSTAFVVIRPDSVARMDYMVQDVPGKDDGLFQMRELINGVFTRVSKPDPFSSLQPAPQAATAGFIKQNYFTCNHEVTEW